MTNTAFYKVTDPEVIAEFHKRLAERSTFLKNWDAEAIRRGFTSAYVINHRLYSNLFDANMMGFVASFEQNSKVDRSIYKYYRQLNKTNEFVLQVKVSNKKAFKEYQNIDIPFDFDTDYIENLFYTKNNATFGSFIKGMNWQNKDILLCETKALDDVYQLNPCLIQIKQSEFLALQGK